MAYARYMMGLASVGDKQKLQNYITSGLEAAWRTLCQHNCQRTH